MRKNNPNVRDITRNVEENQILHEIFRIVSRFPRATFRVISRKIDYLCDSAPRPHKKVAKSPLRMVENICLDVLGVVVCRCCYSYIYIYCPKYFVASAVQLISVMVAQPGQESGF